jgi:hypothetical protein
MHEDHRELGSDDMLVDTAEQADDVLWLPLPV